MIKRSTLLAVGFWLLAIGYTPAANLLENSSFEVGNLRGWSYSAYGASQSIPLTPSTNVAYHGTKSMRLEYDKTTNATLLSSRLYRLIPGQQYTISYYARFDPANNFPNDNIFHLTVYNSKIGAHGPGDWYSGGAYITTNWTRYSMTFTATNLEGKSTYYIIMGPHWANSSGYSYSNQWLNVDAIQLETGASATAYTPLSPVEFGAQTDATKQANIFYDTDTPQVTLHGYNNTAGSVNINVYWRLYDYWNASRASGSTIITFPANSNYTNTITMPAAGRGSFRCLLWAPGIAESITESVYGVVSPPVILTHRTNSAFGTDVLNSHYSLGSAQRLGIHWNRHLSVNAPFRVSYAEPSEGTFVYATNAVARNLIYDIEPVANIGSQRGIDHLPAYFVDGNGWPLNDKWGTFMTNMVTAYKPWVKYWEIFNESTETNSAYTNVLKIASAAIRNVDPGVGVVVGFADFYAYYNGVYLIDLLGTNVIDIWSTHLYWDPSNWGLATNTSTLIASRNKLGWNSETGVRSDSFYQTPLWEELLNTANTTLLPTDEGYVRNHRHRNPEMFSNFFDTIIGKFKTFFYYEMRTTGGQDGLISYSMLDYPLTVKPSGTFYAALAARVDGGVAHDKITIGGITNIWYWTRSNSCIVAVIGNNFISTNATARNLLTTTLSGSLFSVYDYIGNALTYGSGVKFGRDPIYFVGAVGVTTNTVLSSLTITASTDTDPPNLSINTFPTGPMPARFTYRWNASDDSSLDTRWNVNTNAIQYSYRLTPGNAEFSGWTNLSWITYTNLSDSTNYLFEVKAKDASGNQSLASTGTSPDSPINLRVDGNVTFQGNVSF